MPYWIITGKVGAGKTLVSIGKMHEYMSMNRPVATNIDLDLEKIFYKNLHRQPQLIRLPDKPTEHDMRSLGYAYEGDYDEKKTGLVVLDEGATWLNTRDYRDPARQGFINYIVHIRKYGWDLAILVQDETMIDKQARDAVLEYLVKCIRTDRLKLWGFTPPKIHVGKVYYKDANQTKKPEERWVYNGSYYYNAYDTKQVFRADYDKSSYCVLRENYFNPSAKSNIKFLQDPKLKYIAPMVVGLAAIVLFLGLLYVYLPEFKLGGGAHAEQVTKKPEQNPNHRQLKAEMVSAKNISFHNSPGRMSDLKKYSPYRVVGEIIEEGKIEGVISTKIGLLKSSQLKMLGITPVRLSRCFYNINYKLESQIATCFKPEEKKIKYAENIQTTNIQ